MSLDQLKQLTLQKSQKNSIEDSGNSTKKLNEKITTQSHTFKEGELQQNVVNNQKLSIVEEIIERTPRSELSGISNNNISESEDNQAEDDEPQSKYDIHTEFIEEHGILPTPPDNTKDLKDIFLKQAQSIWQQRNI